MKKGQKNRGKCQAKYQSYMGMLVLCSQVIMDLLGVDHCSWYNLLIEEWCYENCTKRKWIIYLYVFISHFNTKVPKHFVFVLVFLYSPVDEWNVKIVWLKNPVADKKKDYKIL